MFLDEAIIDVRGGTGGRGCVGWRREKYVPKGGPDGGDGGRGGSIVLQADENTDTLSNFSSKKRFEAPNGKAGSGSNKRGKDGEDMILLVPPGTTVTETTDKEVTIADLENPGDTLVVAHGGRGGFGNAHFVSSVRQRPDFAELGEPGEKKMLKLELKLVADVGIIGYPSVGKSTLISVISSARPKIGSYPFTTLVPNLGVVTVHERDYVVCDVPGLIEGASKGKGLGDKFLRHIERCGVLVHLLDLSRALREGNEIDIAQLVADYKAIRKELSLYSPALETKKELIVLNKIDLVGGDSAEIEKKLKKEKIPVFLSISSASRININELTEKLFPIVLEERERRSRVSVEDTKKETKELPVIKPHETSTKMGAYRIEKEKDRVVVSGKRLEQFTVMTNFEAPGAVTRFRDVAERIGLLRAIKRARKDDEDMPVFIGKVQVDEYL